VNQLLRNLRPHMVTLVDAFAIPAAWKAAKILEEEDDRQEAMAARDAAVRAPAP
jgi:acyl-CoA oxidase